MVQRHRPGIPVLFTTGYPDYLEHVPRGATVLIKPVPDDHNLNHVRAGSSATERTLDKREVGRFNSSPAHQIV